MKRSLSLALVLFALFAACGGNESPPTGGGGNGGFDQAFAPDEPYPLIASSELVVGENRLLVALQDENDAPVANPTIDMSVELFNLSESSTDPVETADMHFIWTIKPYVGLFVGYVDLPSAGKWGAQVDASGQDFEGNPLEVSAKTSFEVFPEGTTPAIGERVPPSDTPTAADGPLKKISTDAHPDPRFYQLSIKDAIAAPDPFVVVFATPKYCQSQVCGPTLDIVKRVSKDFPQVNFLHVEPYNLTDPTALEPIKASLDWGLPGEPWVFVVDADGRLAAKYEGTVGTGELRTELKSL